ncbi:hypothetical protein JCM5350_003760 [Sporobolomyces pararoseus]
MDNQVTDNLDQQSTRSLKKRRRKKHLDITRQQPSPSLPSSSNLYPTFSSLLSATSILFAATATRVRAAPQPRPNSDSPSRRQLEKSRAIEQSDSASTSIYYSPFPLSTTTSLPHSQPTTTSPLYSTATPPPENRGGKRKRQVLPKYEYSDGSWIVDTGWTLRGSIPSVAPPHTRHRATALADSVETISSQESLPSSSSRSSLKLSSSRTIPSSSSSTTTLPSTTTTSVHTPAFNQHAYASASDVPIPRGWQTRPRETDYYAVPIIIAMSVLVAIIVVIAILGSVCWRKKKRRRRDPEKDFVQEKGWRGIVQRATGKSRGRRPIEEKKKKRKRKIKRSEQETGVTTNEVEVRETAADSQSLRESIGSAGSGSRTPRIVRTTGFSAVSERSAPRWRRRRRNRRDGEDEGGDASEDEERTALTRTDTRSTTSSTGPRDALTARLSARLHGSSSSSSNRGGPSTVFSQLPARTRSSSDLSRSNDPFPRTSTQDSHLTRSTSRSSLYSPPGPIVPPPTILFTPADDPTLSPRPPGTPTFESLSRVPSRTTPMPSPALSSSHPTTSDPLVQTSTPTPSSSSFNALLSHDADMSLPLMPGPPAYRPASSTVQSTRRYGAGDSPSVQRSAATPRSTTPRITNMGRRNRRSRHGGEEAAEEAQGQVEEWHWPGEKGRQGGSDAGAAAGPSSSPFTLSNDDNEETQEQEEEEEPPIDRSLYQAHLATDDKAVLNRLRTATYRSNEDDVEEGGVVEGSRSELPLPSAPPVVEEDGEVDEDGFERFDPRPLENDEESQVGFTTTEKAKLRSPPSPRQTPVSTLLPAPPSRTDFNYSYLTRTASQATPSATPPSTSKSALAAEYAALDPAETEELDLPVYLAQERRNEVLGMASAPPVTGDDDEEEDEAEVEGGVDGEGVAFATI